jgi:hypothetical protein
MGKALIVMGVVLVAAGVLVNFFGNYLGRLPGDLTWRGKDWSVSFPLATCLLLSLLGSLGMWLWNRFSG